MNAYGYREYETVAEKRAKAARSAAKLKKKNANLAPIVCTGRKLATTWWGKAWNDNLERYADYENRIARGRSYVRQGAVLDLQIHEGKVNALVQGSRVKPYQVAVAILPLKPAAWQTIVNACTGNIHSLQELISGKFPQNLADIFTAKGTGLFPSPREISFGCSCPDWADMCKHVAAVLYGIGIRFDEDPTLFFRLRQVNIDELITDALHQTTDTMLDRAGRKSSRALDAGDLAGLFGIALEDTGEKQQVPDLTQPETVPAAAPKKRGRPRKA